MGRKNEPQEQKQRSKRARQFKKEAYFAFGKGGLYMHHPSHESYRKNRQVKGVRKNWDGML